ncbi:hypothetical protein PTKIN_Ptkin11bG0169800 [Pterospermum kingtungense]
MAIKEAFSLLVSSPWAKMNKLIVESDSYNAVQWTNKPESAPWKMRNIINQIECLKSKVCQWEVVHIFREANSIADGLAKEGVLRVDDMVIFAHN